MPHIHELIDFTVSCYIVYQAKVLLVHHKKLSMWLPPGGHIELDENSEEALHREIQEETGLEVEIIEEKPSIDDERKRPPKALPAPSYMDIHHVNDTHRHQNMIFFGRSKTDKAVLEEREHNEMRWFTRQELSEKQYDITAFVQFYANQALTRVMKPAAQSTA